MNKWLAVVTEAADPDDFAALPVPESCRAITLRKEETDLFAGLDSRDKDPRKSMHLAEVPVPVPVPVPEPGPGEVLVAVIASSVNYNTVWRHLRAGAHVRLPGALRPDFAARASP